jgi:hypothetical protein
MAMELRREKVACGMAEAGLRLRRWRKLFALTTDRRQRSAALLGRWHNENGSENGSRRA